MCARSAPATMTARDPRDATSSATRAAPRIDVRRDERHHARVPVLGEPRRAEAVVVEVLRELARVPVVRAARVRRRTHGRVGEGALDARALASRRRALEEERVVELL